MPKLFTGFNERIFVLTGILHITLVRMLRTFLYTARAVAVRLKKSEESDSSIYLFIEKRNKTKYYGIFRSKEYP